MIVSGPYAKNSRHNLFVVNLFLGENVMKELIASLLLMVISFVCTRAEATVMTYNGWTGDNDNIPSFIDSAGDSYGSRITSSSVAYTGDAAISAQFEEGNGWTPNIVVAWAGGQPDNWDTYTGWRGAEVAQVQGSIAGNPLDVVFTPDAGYGVLINSFDLDEWEGGGGCVVNWEVLDDTGILASGTWVGDTAGFRSTVYTGLTEDDVNAGMAVTLRFMQTAGDGTYLAMDDTNFDQFVAENATCPSPADGSVYEDTWATLRWGAGVYAVSHDVYMADNFDDVNDGAAAAFQGNHADPFLTVGFFGFPFPDGLVPGSTYYWRVDEINEADPNSPWKGDVWSFSIPSRKAYNPYPSDGAEFVDPDATLSWKEGFGAKLHYVHFGDNFDDVDNATEGTSAPSMSFTPGTLEKDKTYYWRVDEFNPPNPMVKGDVWTFKTLPVISITDPDLIGWWTFDESGGDIAFDFSGHGNDGTLGRDPERIDGIMKGALNLTSDYVSIDAVADDITSNNLTLSAWIKTTQPGEGNVFASNTGSDHVLMFGVNNGNVYVDDGSETDWPPAVNDDQWHMITLVLSGTTITVYTDGVQVGALVTPIDVSSETRWSIGHEWDSGPSDFYIGMVDDARIYTKALTAQEVLQIMRGDLQAAWNPSPGSNSTSDVRRAASVSWSPGDSASQHAVYFGTDRDAVAGADTSDATGVFRALQAGTTYTPPEGVEWGGGPYYWRIDEHNTDGTINKGSIWSFSVSDYIIVDDFESYNDIPAGEPGSNLVYVAWVDGFENPNANGSTMGYVEGVSLETDIVHGGNKSAPFEYKNAPAVVSEVVRTFAPAQDWTDYGIQTLSLWFFGDPTNTLGQLYVKINGVKADYDGAAGNLALAGWQVWNIDLASVGANLQSVTSLAIGVEGLGATGMLFLDDIRLYR